MTKRPKRSESSGRGTRHALGVGLACLVLSACAPRPEARYVRTANILQRLLEQSSCSRAVLGDAKLAVRGPFVSIQGDLLYRAEVPENLRFDLYSPLGVTLSTLTTNGERLALYDLPSKSFSEGAPSACSLERFTRVRIAPYALVELLRGRPPIVAHDPSGSNLRFSTPAFGRGRYVVRIEGGAGFRERIEIVVPREDYEKPLQEQRLRLSSVRLEYLGRLVYQVELSDYRLGRRASLEPTVEEREMGLQAPPPTGPMCDAELPGRLNFSVGSGGYRLHIINQEVFHNPPATDGAYEQNRPAGVHTLSFDCE